MHTQVVLKEYKNLSKHQVILVCDLWHINLCRLFNAKFSIHIY